MLIFISCGPNVVHKSKGGFVNYTFYLKIEYIFFLYLDTYLLNNVIDSKVIEEVKCS